MIVAADVGRTTCRLQVGDAAIVRVANGASLADRDGAAAVLDALVAAAGRAGAGAADPSVTNVAVGVTGAGQAPAAAAELGDALRHRYPAAGVSVASDVVTAHLGALGGRAGVVTIAGTGAVALGVAADGRSHLVDGHGPLLGDAGSGTWIGRRALAAALSHHDGRPGGSAALAAVASERFGPLARLPGTVQTASRPWRDIAAFVPDVAAAATAGDPVSRRTFAAAVRELAATTRAAARATGGASNDDRPPRSGTPVLATVVGGLADLIDLVRDPLADALARGRDTASSDADHDLEVRLVAADGDALAGARRLAEAGPGVHHHLVLELPATQATTAPMIDRRERM